MVRRHRGHRVHAGRRCLSRRPGGSQAIARRRATDGVTAPARRRRSSTRWRRDDAVAYHVAAVRETFEEAGILLACDRQRRFVRLDDAELHVRFTRHRRDVHSGARSLRDVIEAEGLRVALDALVPFAHWLTPPIDVRRFDTRFFLTARCRPAQTPAHDDTETTHSGWVTPADALARCRRGEMSLPPPTWTTLRELEAFRTRGSTLLDVGASGGRISPARAAVCRERRAEVAACCRAIR